MYLTYTYTYEPQTSDTTRQVYRFLLLGDRDLSFVLDYYAVEERQTKRHKWRTTSYYDRTMKRESTLKTPPLVPGDIIEKAIGYFRGLVRFKPEET